MMFERYVRTALLAGVMQSTELRFTERVERRIAGGRAASVRAKVAHRAAMAMAFRQLKRHAKP